MLSVIVADKHEDVAAADRCKLIPRPLHITQAEAVRMSAQMIARDTHVTRGGIT